MGQTPLLRKVMVGITYVGGSQHLAAAWEPTTEAARIRPKTTHWTSCLST